MSGNEDGPLPFERRAGQGDQFEAADFISSGLASLADMARRHRLDTLSYLIDMAKMEADEALKAFRGR